MSENNAWRMNDIGTSAKESARERERDRQRTRKRPTTIKATKKN